MDHLNKKIDNTQRRMQYDITQKAQEIINVIKTSAVPQDIQSFFKNANDLKLPVDTMENFIIFEKELETNEKNV